MRNFFKYSSIRLRDGNAPCTPQGPSFSRAKNITLRLDDNAVCFNAPKHAPLLRSVTAKGPWYKDNALNCRPVPKKFMPNQRWSELHVLTRNWSFYGPWFIGEVGDLHMTGLVVAKNQDACEANELSGSFFHPRSFEYALGDYLSSNYGHKYDSDGPDWIAPINWESFKCGDLFGAQFDVGPFSSPNKREHFVAVPISDGHILLLSFSVGGRVESKLRREGEFEFEQVGPDKFKFNQQPLLGLMEKIIQSISITLSPKNQQAYDKIKAENPELKMAVSDTLAPLQWPVK